MSIWNTIHQNFKDCIEDSTTGVNSLTSVSTNYVEADIIDLRALPSSIYDGAYSIRLETLNGATEDLGTGVVDFDYSVQVQLAYELSPRSEKQDYNNAINDSEEVVRRRLHYDTYKDTDILNITFANANRMLFVGQEELERWAIVELLFRVQGRTNLNS